MVRWILYFDGSCGPTNPGGNACYGWILISPSGNEYSGKGHVCSGQGATNNVAEFGALEAGLLYMIEKGLKVPILCKGDSQLVVNLVSGRWKGKKPHLLVRKDRCIKLLNEIDNNWKIRWIPRDQNERADILSTSVLPDGCTKWVYPNSKKDRKKQARISTENKQLIHCQHCNRSIRQDGFYCTMCGSIGCIEEEEAAFVL